jgi:hypothetical protein
MGSPSIPKDFTLTTSLDADIASTFDGTVNTNLNSNSTLNSTSDVTAKLIGDPKQPLATLLIGDPKQPITTSSSIELVNLPRFTLQDIKDLLKVRVRIPNYSQLCFKFFGQELFSICLNGEGQVITEPYVPNAMERCEVDCCEPDTRPFPEGNPIPGKPGNTVPGK